MKSNQSENVISSDDDDLGQATVRELIVQLALAEDEYRNAANPGRIEALARREQAIVAALHRNGLALKYRGNSNPPSSSAVLCSIKDHAVQKLPL